MFPVKSSFDMAALRCESLCIQPFASFALGDSLGTMIRQAKAGISRDFRADIIAYDDHPDSGVDPFSDIRSSFDSREDAVSVYNSEAAARHEQTSSLTAMSGSAVGPTGATLAAAAAAPSVEGAVAPAAE